MLKAEIAGGGSSDANHGHRGEDRVFPVTSAGRWMVLGLLVCALGLRVAVVLESAGWYEPRTDALHFDITASSLASGEGFGHAIVPPNTAEQEEPTAFRAPLYPMALAGVYAGFGEHSWTWGRILNAVLGTGVVALLGVVVTQLWSRRLGYVAMGIAALHPALILVGSSLQLEPLFVCLMLGALAAALQHRRSPRGRTWPVVAGALAGMMILTRETGFLVLPGLAWLLWTAPGDGPDLRGVKGTARDLAPPLLMVACAIAVVVPWTARNAVVLGELVPVSTSSGVGLSGTFNETSMTDDEFPAGWRQPWEDPAMAELMLALDDPTEAEADQALRSASLDVIQENPEYLVKAGIWNSLRLFELDGGRYSRAIAPFVPYSLTLLNVSIVASYALFAAALVGALRHRRLHARVPVGVWAIPVALYPFFVVLLPGNTRYRFMIEPFIILLAVPLVAEWAEALLRRLQRPQFDRLLGSPTARP